MFSSTIIPTIGRSSLARAVLSVLDQEVPADDFEIIVVNDSGHPLPEESWQHSNRVRLIETNRRERSVARNCGAAIARGRYVHFLDDDDWLLDDALDGFLRLARAHEEAAWLHGGIRIVDAEMKNWGEINSQLSGNCFAQIVGGAWAPLQASLIETRAFHEVGGFDPLVTVTEDLDLCRRIALTGDFAYTPMAVACLFREVSWDTSSDYLRGPAINRLYRDKVLSQCGVFRRLYSSNRAGYWQGRVLRIYLASFALNLRSKSLSTASSRLIHAFLLSLLAGHRLFYREFWDAFREAYVRDALYHILVAMESQATQVTLDSGTGG